MERNSVNGVGVWASDTAYLQHTIHKVTAVQKRESDRLNPSGENGEEGSAQPGRAE